MSANLLRDPFYGQIVASIAVTTALANREAQKEGQQFTTSQVRSVYHRVAQTLEGKPPKAKEPTSAKERRQNALYDELLAMRETIIVTNKETGEKGPLSVPMYLKAMRAAKESAKPRKGETGDSSYLDYAEATLQRVEAEPDPEDEETDEAKENA